MNLYTKRKLINAFNLSAAILTTLAGLAILGWILGVVFYQGIAAINWSIFTEMTPPPGSSGGLANAIVGSLLLTGVAILIGTPIGVLAGTWLAEYGRGTKMAEALRILNDVLLSAPSIVIGIFVYLWLVEPTGRFSGWAGSVALAIIFVPVVLRTTENMLLLVPTPMREAAAALGAPRWFVTTRVVYRAAMSGIMTGVLLATAHIFGETAPLLFTALSNQFWSTDMSGPMSSLTVVIYNYAMSPYDDWRQLAWGGVLIITIMVLLLNVLARLLIRGNR